MNTKHFIFPADINGRFFKCIECGNEHFSPDARFCKLCGTFLFNVCGETNADEVECGASVSPDARYCEYCGNETLLMKKGKLLRYEDIYSEDIGNCIEEYAATRDEFAYDLEPVDIEDVPF